MIKLFVNDKVILLTSNFDEITFDNLTRIHQLRYRKILVGEVKNFIKSRKDKQLILIHSDLKKLKNVFFESFPIIIAAGGMVMNQKHQFLFILRRGKWDLPKGKMDEGEKKRETALREVEEETGIGNLEIIKKIGNTYHMFTSKHRWVVKKSVWYEMKSSSLQKPVPQTDEDITEAKWLGRDQIEKSLKNSYPNIKDLVDRYFEGMIY